MLCGLVTFGFITWVLYRKQICRNIMPQLKCCFSRTRLDPWGVVANEACAAGIPVITCPNAGVADDLILHGYNGFVLELDAAVWCQHVWKLLADRALLDAFSQNALTKVHGYNYEVAAQGIVAALKFAASPNLVHEAERDQVDNHAILIGTDREYSAVP